MTTKIPVTVLGATGVVGQRFVRRLANHPLFRVEYLAASERSRPASAGPRSSVSRACSCPSRFYSTT